MKNSLGFGVRVGIATALGITFALVIHISYTIMGFALLFQQHPVLFHSVQLLGAAYLIWLGYHALTAADSELNLEVKTGDNNLSVGTPALTKWIYGTEIIAAVALWFVTLSFSFNQHTDTILRLYQQRLSK